MMDFNKLPKKFSSLSDVESIQAQKQRVSNNMARMQKVPKAVTQSMRADRMAQDARKSTKVARAFAGGVKVAKKIGSVLKPVARGAALGVVGGKATKAAGKVVKRFSRMK